MKDDPIVEEVHRARERLLEENDGDLNKLMDRLQERESHEHGPLIRYPAELKSKSRSLAS